jgi:hypothetical protein
MHFEDGNGNKVDKIPVGSSGFRNVVKIQNGAQYISTDAKIDVVLPNSAPYSSPGRREFEFTHPTTGTRRTGWTAQFNALGAGMTDIEQAPMTCLAPRPCKVTFQCRNGQVWDVYRNKYVSSNNSIPFTEQVDVV